eukprot:CAMPEP_0116148860 /NCGR_PEP_ID=MMETSP0329-20121206/18607_1 /TAXON_ID=697910 /ORGANISM="Pseudo-nitzschia arenysensis, Strain B593" /LENGTH=905 /DNA_ID=CAMNT_0003645071 /DNA_START=47 /DNA_END=2764 /DNA_ORIENTATION=+
MKQVFSLRLSENGPLRSNLTDSGKNSVAAENHENTVDDDARDDGGKRVVFHPNILSASSGDDLSFDPTRVFSSNHRQEPSRMTGDGEQRDDRGILSNAKSANASEEDLNRSANEVYTGMSRRCRADLLKGEELGSPRMKGMKIEAKPAAHIAATSKSNSFLDELKVRIPTTGASKQPGNITSRWLKEQQEAEELPAAPSPNVLSPRKFSVAKINQARSGPPPKSDDFFSELKQWHSSFALRNVEAPSEITVTGPVTATSSKSEQEEEKEAIVMKETDKAAADAKKALAKVEKEYTKKKKEEKVMIKKMEKEAKKTNKKEKKKFWKLPMRSKRKQKTEDVIAEEEPKAEESPEPEESNLGLAETSTQVPLKEPAFDDHLTNFLKLQSEIVKERKSADEVDDEKPNELSKEMLVETVTSAEEDTSICSEVETKDLKLDPEGEEPKDEPAEERAEEAVQEEQVEDKAVEEEPATEEPIESEKTTSVDPDKLVTFSELLQTESWLEQASSFLKDKFNATEEIQKPTPFPEPLDLGDSEMDTSLEGSDLSTNVTDSLIESLNDSLQEDESPVPEPTSEELKDDEKEDEDEEKPIEIKTEESGILGKLSGFFKKDETVDPPMLVVEVDKYEMDKYEAIAATGEEETYATQEESAPSIKIDEREENDHKHLYSSFDNELREEVDYFFQSQCSCFGGQQGKSRKMKKVEEKEPSWMELATEFFTPKATPEPAFAFDESETIASSIGGKTEKTEKTEKASNIQEVVVMTPEQLAQKPTEEEIIESPFKSTPASSNAEHFDVMDLVQAASTLTKEEIQMIESYEDNIMTLPDGTRVIKMAALMNLHASQSRCESPRRSKKKSTSLVDSKDQKKNKKSNKKKQKERGGATLFGTIGSSSKKNNKKKDKKKRGQTLF